MAMSERIRYFRKKRGMTQKQLGILAGLPLASAEVRITQYETLNRSPRPELTERLANVLNVSPLALTVPNIDTVGCLVHTFFALEDMYGLKIIELEGTPCLRLDLHHEQASSALFNVFNSWLEQSRKLETGEIRKEEYDSWRYNFSEIPVSSSERCQIHSCPHFECLLFVADLCEKYPSCVGCGNLYACRVCSKKEAAISHQFSSCKLINLENRCRCCSKRNSPNFSHAECIRCKDE